MSGLAWQCCSSRAIVLMQAHTQCSGALNGTQTVCRQAQHTEQQVCSLSLLFGQGKAPLTNLLTHEMLRRVLTVRSARALLDASRATAASRALLSESACRQVPQLTYPQSWHSVPARSHTV